MRIYYPLLCYFPSQAGGPANTIFWLNEALAKLGIVSSVTSTFFGQRDFADKDFSKLYNPINEINFVNSYLGFFSKKELKKLQNSEVIHFSSLFFPPTFILVLIGIILKKKIIVSPRGELYPDALKKSKFLKNTYLILFSLFSKWIAFHATNEVEKSQIQNKFKKNKGVYNLPNFMPIASNSYNGNNGEVLFLGRLNQIKNLESLIEAIFILKSEFGKEVKLSISGEARIESEKAYKQNLINLVEKLKVNKLITFLGQTEGIDKITLLKDSCCLVLPSKSENFGNVVIEALSCGTPVIASLGTPWGALEKEGVGFWVEPSPKAIADKINFYLNLRKDEYIKIGYNAKKYVLDNFEISRNIYKWKKLYNEL